MELAREISRGVSLLCESAKPLYFAVEGEWLRDFLNQQQASDPVVR